jgi:hypothetical protein
MSDSSRYAQYDLSLGGLPKEWPVPIPLDPEAWRGRIVWGANQTHWYSDGDTWIELLQLPISTPSAIAPTTPEDKLQVRMTDYESVLYPLGHTSTRFEIFFTQYDDYDGQVPDLVFDYELATATDPPARPFSHDLPKDDFDYGQQFYWRGLYRAGSVQSRFSVPFAQQFPDRIEDPFPVTLADSQTSTLEMTPFQTAFPSEFGYYTYEYEVALDPDFVNVVVSGDGTVLDVDGDGAQGVMTIETSALVDGTKYYWRARYVAFSTTTNPSEPDGRWRSSWTTARSFFPTPFTLVMEFDTNAEPSLGLSVALELESYAGQQLTGQIDWGDGQVSPINHTGVQIYSPPNNGEFLAPNDPTGVTAPIRYVVRVTIDLKNTLRSIGSNNFRQTYPLSQRKLVAISAFGQDMGITELGYAFAGCRNLILLPPQLPLSYDEFGEVTTRVTGMTEAFSGCTKLTTPAIGGWDVTAVGSFWSTFSGCTGFNAPIEGWEPKAATELRSMFRNTAFNRNIDGWAQHFPTNAPIVTDMFSGCSDFNQPLLSWGPKFSGVSDFSGFLQNCSQFNQSLATFFPVGNTTTDVDNMLAGCAKFSGAGIEAWDTSSWRYSRYLFDGCLQLNPDLSAPSAAWSFDLLLEATGMFRNCQNLLGTGFSTLTFPSLFKPDWMFQNCYKFDADVSGWFPVGGTVIDTLRGMFYGTQTMTFRGLGMDLWDVGAVTDISYLLRNCGAFNVNITGWDVSAVGSDGTGGMLQTFYGCSALDQDFTNWQNSPTQTIQDCFFGCSRLGATVDPHIRLWLQNMPNITSTVNLFRDCTAYNENFDNLNAPSTAFGKITDTYGMFLGCSIWNNGDTPRGTAFPISWDFTAVTRTGAMFQAAIEFNQPLNISLPELDSSASMFRWARNYAQDLSAWRLPKLRDAAGMFYGASDFNSDVSDWFVTKDNAAFPLVGTTTMFYYATTFNSGLGLGAGGTRMSTWPMDKVVSLRWMFTGSNFNQDISPWTITDVMTDMSYTFGVCEFNFGQAQGAGAYQGITYANGSTDPFANWDLSNVTSWIQTFVQNDYFNANMDSVFTDPLKTANITSMRQMFNDADRFNNGADPAAGSTDYSYPLAWSLPALLNVGYMFCRARRFRQSLRNFSAPRLQDMEFMFYDNKQYEDRIGEIQYWPSIRYVATMAGLCNGDVSTEQMVIPTADLDAIYVKWGTFANQGLVQYDVTVHWGNSVYTALGQQGRDVLISDTHSWNISGDQLQG